MLFLGATLDTFHPFKVILLEGYSGAPESLPQPLLAGHGESFLLPELQGFQFNSLLLSEVGSGLLPIENLGVLHAHL